MVNSRIFLFLLLLIQLLTTISFGQKQKGFQLKAEFDSDQKWLRRINYTEKFADSLSMRSEMTGIRLAIYKKSHFAASLDSFSCLERKCTAYFYVGQQLTWARLEKGNMEEDVLSKTGYRDKVYNEYPFRYRQFGRFVESILAYYENNGYPFVNLSLDGIKYVNEKGIRARLKLDKSRYVEIDTIEIYGDKIVSEKYLYNYLNIKPHKPYSEENIKLIQRRFEDLSFVDEEKGATVIFTETETKLQLFLKKQRASRFDGIIGVLQNDKNSKVQFTGDVKLSLMNTFKRGELIGLNWRGLPNNTQDLNLKFNYPYLFNSPFGMDVDFKLYKRDTTFLDVIYTFGIMYAINSRDYLKLLYQNHQSNLLSVSQYENARVLPQVLDFKINLYGLELSLNKLDYLLNPKKGFRILANARAGYKNVQKNSGIPDSLYNNVSLSNAIFRAEFNGAYFFPLAFRHVLMIGNQSAYLKDDLILQNEMYRIGGLRTLRGFNEESIFVSSYAINTFEYRFILEKNSYLSIFLDYAYVENQLYGIPTTFDTPYGFGVGSTFETGAGIFSISYAAGSQQNNPIDLKSAKVHFGFLNYF